MHFVTAVMGFEPDPDALSAEAEYALSPYDLNDTSYQTSFDEQFPLSAARKDWRQYPRMSKQEFKDLSNLDDYMGAMHGAERDASGKCSGYGCMTNPDGLYDYFTQLSYPLLVTKSGRFCDNISYLKDVDWKKTDAQATKAWKSKTPIKFSPYVMVNCQGGLFEPKSAEEFHKELAKNFRSKYAYIALFDCHS